MSMHSSRPKKQEPSLPPPPWPTWSVWGRKVAPLRQSNQRTWRSAKAEARIADPRPFVDQTSSTCLAEPILYIGFRTSGAPSVKESSGYEREGGVEVGKLVVISRMLTTRPRIVAAAVPYSVSISSKSRFHSTSTNPHWAPLPTLNTPTLSSFRNLAFHPSQPIQFPNTHFTLSLPAIQKWFLPGAPTTTGISPHSLPNHAYLNPFASTLLPLELVTDTDTDTDNADGKGKGQGKGKRFERASAPLEIWLEWSKLALQTPSLAANTPTLYLAQAPLSRLPEALKLDLPTPGIVLEAGRGDVYDANLWMGVPPTYTPLHRDPNPNLFVQLAGRKVVRLMEPAVGEEVFAGCKRKAGKGALRYRMGDEMMQGEERELLEREVWGEGVEGVGGYEGIVEVGGGVFIPNGWWHSIKGVSEGVTASANWWFR